MGTKRDLQQPSLGAGPHPSWCGHWSQTAKQTHCLAFWAALLLFGKARLLLHAPKAQTLSYSKAKAHREDPAIPAAQVGPGLSRTFA